MSDQRTHCNTKPQFSIELNWGLGSLFRTVYFCLTSSEIAFAFYIAAVLMVTLATTTCLAANDPLSVVNNLSNFIFSLIRAIGMILLGFGIMQVGLSLKSHDPSQRANGFLTLAGGIIITFTKEILNMITG